MPDLPTRALTLWQPWAWLVSYGHKPIESRPREFSHKSFRGEFWIHASKTQPADTYRDAQSFCARILGERFYLPPVSALPSSAIVGRATIVDVLPVPDICRLPDGWRMAGRFAFVLKDARALEKPIHCRGYQGFWNVPADVLSELERVA